MKSLNPLNIPITNKKHTIEPKRREGEVSIDKPSKQKKQSNSSVGEYVDFEEIDDNS